jgi:hypothetical protein
MDKTYRVVINPHFGLGGLFDMLRYDNATVLGWAQGVPSDIKMYDNVDTSAWYTLRLKGRNVADRWRSFGFAVFSDGLI